MTNSQMHKITTRQTFDLYMPAANLTVYKKVFITKESRFTTIYTKTIKELSGDKNKFKLALEVYLLHNYFYSLKEYFDTHYFHFYTVQELRYKSKNGQLLAPVSIIFDIQF